MSEFMEYQLPEKIKRLLKDRKDLTKDLKEELQGIKFVPDV